MPGSKLQVPAPPPPSPPLRLWGMMITSNNRCHKSVSLQAVDKFLQAKGKLDGNGAPPLNDIMETLHSLTTVRANLAAGLSSGG